MIKHTLLPIFNKETYLQRIAYSTLLFFSLSSPLFASPDVSWCITIDDSSARLACYDKVFGRSNTIPAKASTIDQSIGGNAAGNSIVDFSNQKITDQKQKVADFGMSAKPPPKSETIESIESTVTRVSSLEVGKTLLTLANGQHWLLSEDDGRISRGVAVVINRGALGSFNLVTKDRHSYRVKRID